MKKLLLPFLLLGTVSLVAAATPESLEINKEHVIKIISNLPGELAIVPEVIDNSEGRWTLMGSKKPPESDSGTDVTSSGTYVFPDDSEVVLVLMAKIEGDKVFVKGSWPTESSAKGFVRLDLRVPHAIASDLVIEADGKVVFSGFDGPVQYLKNQSELVFKKASTGTFLFALTGEIHGGSLVFNAEKPEGGVLVRIDNTPNGIDSSINAVTQAEWTLLFNENAGKK